MNAGRQLLQLSRGALRQQALRRNVSGEQTASSPHADMKEHLSTSNPEGVMIARAVFGAMLLWTIGRCTWLHFHVFPKTTEFEDENTPPTWR